MHATYAMKRTVAIECGFAGKMVWLLDNSQKNSFNLGKKLICCKSI
jgi:hypothetical protein